MQIGAYEVRRVRGRPRYADPGEASYHQSVDVMNVIVRMRGVLARPVSVSVLVLASDFAAEYAIT